MGAKRIEGVIWKVMVEVYKKNGLKGKVEVDGGRGSRGREGG